MKCSAVGRVYVPRSLWPAGRDLVVSQLESIRLGDVRDFGNFMGAVIDARAFQKITGYLDEARRQRNRPYRILRSPRARSCSYPCWPPTVSRGGRRCSIP